MTLERLLDAFVRADRVSFTAFKLIWKQMRFSEVHFLHQLDKSYTLYHRNQREALQKRRILTAFKTLLGLAVLQTNPKRRIAAVYCLYCLYSTQPTSPKHPVPISPKIFRILFTFARADEEKLGAKCGALQLLHRMYAADAFMFQLEDGVLSLVKSVHKGRGEEEEATQFGLKPLDPKLLEQITSLTSHKAPPEGVNNLLPISQDTTHDDDAALLSPPPVELSKPLKPKSIDAESTVVWKPLGTERLELPDFLPVVKPMKQKKSKKKKAPLKAGSGGVVKEKQKGGNRGKGRRRRSEKTVQVSSDDDSDLDALENQVFGDMTPTVAPSATQAKSKEQSTLKKRYAVSTKRAHEREDAVETTVKQSIAAAKEMEALLAGERPPQDPSKRRSPRNHTSRQTSAKPKSVASTSAAPKTRKPKHKTASKRAAPRSSSSRPPKKMKASSEVPDSDDDTDLMNSLALAKEMEGMLGQSEEQLEKVKALKVVRPKRKRRVVSSSGSVSKRPKQALSKPKRRLSPSRACKKKPSTTIRAQSFDKRSSRRTRSKSVATSKVKPTPPKASGASEDESSDDGLLKGSKALADSLSELLSAK